MRMGCAKRISSSRLVKAAKQGKEVFVAERGKPPAVVKLIEGPGNAHATVRRLESVRLGRHQCGPKTPSRNPGSGGPPAAPVIGISSRSSFAKPCLPRSTWR